MYMKRHLQVLEKYPCKEALHKNKDNSWTDILPWQKIYQGSHAGFCTASLLRSAVGTTHGLRSDL